MVVQGNGINTAPVDGKGYNVTIGLSGKWTFNKSYNHEEHASNVTGLWDYGLVMLGDYAASVETTLSNIATAKIGATLLDGAYMNVLTLAPGDGTGVTGRTVRRRGRHHRQAQQHRGPVGRGRGGDKPRHHWHAA
jgi:hypothetical protein